MSSFLSLSEFLQVSLAFFKLTTRKESVLQRHTLSAAHFGHEHGSKKSSGSSLVSKGSFQTWLLILRKFK